MQDGQLSDGGRSQVLRAEITVTVIRQLSDRVQEAVSLLSQHLRAVVRPGQREHHVFEKEGRTADGQRDWFVEPSHQLSLAGFGSGEYALVRSVFLLDV